ncbi:type I secretion system permease/ATPase, partial [Klebsiella pneumoniae]|nr:type I secretion system permease/ATPase [Klebsiella pneumoniae]
DPLLDSLLTLCVLHQKPASRAMLTTGLPLPAQRLTPDLLPRAAARAGLQGRVLQRKLEQIPSIAMPAMLLLNEGRSAVLVGWENE